MKKLAALLLAVLLAGFTAGGSVLCASTPAKIVILVSDNPADLAMAKFVSNVTGFPIVVTPWGIYDPSVSARVLAYNPGEVIIIGGPLAVLDDYATDLKGFNVTVVRWWGETRYGTNKAVIKGLESMGLISPNATFLVPGNDTFAIAYALRLALKDRGVILYVNSTLKSESLKNPVLVVSPMSEKIGKKVEDVVKPVSVVRANVTEKELEDLILQLEAKLGSIRNLTANDSQLKGLLNLAQDNLNSAKEELQKGNLQMAYRYAMMAGFQIDLALKMANENPSAKLQLDLQILELQTHGMAQIDPETLVKLKGLLDQLREALKEHDYEKARRIEMEIRLLLLKTIREHGIIPPAPLPGQLLLP
ncbi:hypothetical protein [Thermococcus sp.]|uniref:cell wall-binding repeat-containing protein n=1 Tax=Thermococcus sp. TaxID=35749 RepID=UPI002608F987|nr:hypothetical protein [Thermococcus sp.]